MTDHRVVAVRYAERETTLSDVYYRWASYGEPDGPIDMAYYFWFVEPPDGPPIVVDSGFAPEVGARKGRHCSCEPADALARLGIDPADVQQVVVTHLHYDHIGNLGLFPNAELVVAPRPATASALVCSEKCGRAAIGSVQKSSSRRRRGPGAHRRRGARGRPGDRRDPCRRPLPWQLVLSVSTAGGGVLLASDAVHYYHELETERPFAVLADLADVYRAYDTVHALAGGGRAMIPGDDPLVMDRYPPLHRADDLAVRIA